MHDQRDNHVRTQGEDGRLQAKEGGLRRKPVCRLLDLRSPASKLVRKKTFTAEATQFVWYFVTAALAD